MTDDKSNRSQEQLTELCCRIERMCRYSPLIEEEVLDESSMKDRGIVEGLYIFYRNKGYSQEVSARMARAGAIGLVLTEVFS